MKALPWYSRDSSQIDDQAEDNQEDDEEYFKECEPKLYLSVYSNERDSDEEREQDSDDNPHRGIDVGPELEKDANCRYLCRNRQPVAVYLCIIISLKME